MIKDCSAQMRSRLVLIHSIPTERKDNRVFRPELYLPLEATALCGHPTVPVQSRSRYPGQKSGIGRRTAFTPRARARSLISECVAGSQQRGVQVSRDQCTTDLADLSRSAFFAEMGR